MPSHIKPLELVYVPTAKAACTSLKVLFLSLCGIELKDSAFAHDVIEDERLTYPVERVTFKRAIDLRDSGEKLAMFIRNPYARLVSSYCDKIGEPGDNSRDLQDGLYRGFKRYGTFKAGMSFKEFVEAVSAIPDGDSDWHIRSYSFDMNLLERKVDFVGRVETLRGDVLKLVGNRLDWEWGIIPHEHKQTKGDWRDYYDKETVRLVTERYQRDIEDFGYSFERKEDA